MVYSADECEPEPPRCFDPFFNEVPCPVDPCSQPGFPGCSQPPPDPDPPGEEPEPEVVLPTRQRDPKALARTLRAPAARLART